MMEIRISDYRASIVSVFGNGLREQDLRRFILDQAQRLNEDCSVVYNNKKRLLPLYRKNMIFVLDYYG